MVAIESAVAAGMGAVAAGPLCLVCGGAGLEEFLDLGASPLANAFLTREQLAEPEARYPLRVAMCAGCGHVQLLDRVPPEAMFGEYLYVSSASRTLLDHFEALADTVVRREELAKGEAVMDIGSNDGSLLAAFARRGMRVLGIDPARNLAALARERGVETETVFFGAATAARIRSARGPARVLTATNSLPHIPALDDYFAGVRTLLAPDGVFVAEAHYLADVDGQSAFDTIYHEHVSYWSLKPLMRLLDEHSLEVFRAERLPVHHGQLRVWVAHRGARTTEASVRDVLAEERRLRLHDIATWRAFARRAQAVREGLREELRARKRRGQRIAGYGAPAKATTLLAWLGLGPEWIEYIADRSRLKQGRYTPGTHIPIVGPERIAADPPDALVLLAWNFAAEIKRQLAGYEGEYILPLDGGGHV